MRITSQWYRDRGFEVLFGEDPAHAHGPFNSAATRNWLMQHMTANVKVLSDADTVPEEGALFAAMEAAAVDGLMHLPYHLYRDSADVYTFGASSGIFVGTQAAWDSTNGQDELFNGWGFEDSAWRLAHLTLNGPIPRHRGVATAAVHELASRDQLSTNRKRFAQYQIAYGKPELMQLLVNGGDLPREHMPLSSAARARATHRGIRL